MEPRFLLVLSEPDPVASAVGEVWGSLPATGDHFEGAAIRQLSPTARVVRRPGWHVNDERLDLRLPASLRNAPVTIVFPSIHRSREDIACFTVHALGNLGPAAEVGGRPRTVNPTDPRAMADVLRKLSADPDPGGLPTTYEATHHGPELGVPSFFAEIGFGAAAHPPLPAVRRLAEVLREIAPDSRDHTALGAGGGHYAPHFTDLALRRRWALGHIVSRHALESIDAPTARAALNAVPNEEGILYVRAADADHAALRGLGPRRRDGDAEARAGAERGRSATAAARPSGT